MYINVYTIEKKTDDTYDSLIDYFIKISRSFATINSINCFNKNIAKAQRISAIEAKKCYTKAFDPYLKGVNIALDVNGKVANSYQFSSYLCTQTVNFFIGGSYGLEQTFIKLCDQSLSLSGLTMSHKMAKLVLFEQIFRGLSINHNHPYHKQ